MDHLSNYFCFREVMESAAKKTRTKKTAVAASQAATASEPPSLLTIISQISTENPSVEEQPLPVIAEKTSRKGKKPIQVVAVVTADGIQGSFPSEQRRPLIGHLPISSASVSFNDEADEEVSAPEPFPYDDTICTYGAPYHSTSETKKSTTCQNVQPAVEIKAPTTTTVSTTPIVKPMLSTTVPSFTQVQLFAEYIGAREQKQIPDKTDIACLWCCEQFSWKPAVIPSRYESDVMNGQIKGQYRVYGNFCCPECALSYLLQEHIDTNARWERISWMHLIYGKVSGGRLYPAPSRMTLKKFGGIYSIEEFRDLAITHKIRADIHYPPMVSLLATMDTKPIDFYEAPIKQALPTYAFEREGTGEDGLRLKRTKPLKERDSTLDACVQIKMRGE
jgi:hypothetical protein